MENPVRACPALDSIDRQEWTGGTESEKLVAAGLPGRSYARRGGIRAFLDDLLICWAMGSSKASSFTSELGGIADVLSTSLGPSGRHSAGSCSTGRVF